MSKIFLPFVTSGSQQQWRLKIEIEKVEGDRLDINFGPDTNQMDILGYTSLKLNKNLTLAVALIEELTS